jgi:hypothetical protein
MSKRICHSCEKQVGKSYLKIDRESGSDPRAETRYYCLTCAPEYFMRFEPLSPIMLSGGSNVDGAKGIIPWDNILAVKCSRHSRKMEMNQP